MSHPDLAVLADAVARPLELAIVLPTFNERGNLATLVERLDKALAGIAWEAIFVDDNSPDGTGALADAIATTDARVLVLHRLGKERLSRAYVDVKIEGVPLNDVNMFHIHCGKPGILGPILVDFALATDLQKNLADGTFSVEITNEHIVKTAEHGHGPIAAFTAGCVVPSASLAGLEPTKVSTVAGMAQIASEGELYFNLHTTGQTYYGDIRGQLLPAAP